MATHADRIALALLVAGSLTAIDAGAAAAPAPFVVPHDPVVEVSFSADVMPIFENRCLECHGGGVDENGDTRLEGYLDLTTYEGLMAGSEYGTVIEPGNAEESVLIDMIETGDMPEEGDPVPPEEIAIIRAWIDEGAQNN